MENKSIIKCSLEEHKEINANTFCQECKINMCNKCLTFHSNLFKNHHTYNLDSDIKDIFTGLCQEQNHLIKLEYYCKTHNVLCCSSCIAKIKRKGNCQHFDCYVTTIEDISKEKKNKLLKNIKTLENLSTNIEQLIDQLKNIYEEIDKEKNELKSDVQKIFTRIRNVLNEQEDKLLIDIDERFEKKFFNENFLKESEKLPKKIKLSLDKGKVIYNEWNDDNLYSLINDCINIEKNNSNINKINEIISKYKNNNSQIKMKAEEQSIIFLTEHIQNFCSIYEYDPTAIKKKDYNNLFN